MKLSMLVTIVLALALPPAAQAADHGYLGYAAIVNKKFREGLPADIRAILEKAMRETAAYERDIVQNENDEALEKARAAGTTRIHARTKRAAALVKPVTV